MSLFVRVMLSERLVCCQEALQPLLALWWRLTPSQMLRPGGVGGWMGGPARPEAVRSRAPPPRDVEDKIEGIE